ncbi:hypothetical protein Hanom_Chr10g00930551 [Helianthus anomalus]
MFKAGNFMVLIIVSNGILLLLMVFIDSRVNSETLAKDGTRTDEQAIGKVKISAVMCCQA